MNTYIKFLLHAIYIFVKKLEIKERRERKNLREIRTFQTISFYLNKNLKKKIFSLPFEKFYH